MSSADLARSGVATVTTFMSVVAGLLDFPLLGGFDVLHAALWALNARNGSKRRGTAWFVWGLAGRLNVSPICTNQQQVSDLQFVLLSVCTIPEICCTTVVWPFLCKENEKLTDTEATLTKPAYVVLIFFFFSLFWMCWWLWPYSECGLV